MADLPDAPWVESLPDAPWSAKPTGYFDTQSGMARESFDQMSRGVGQLSDAFKFAASGAGRNRATMDPEQLNALREQEKQGVSNVVHGFGNTVAGGLGYVASPVNAALRTFVGEPVEKATGIPKEYTEFAASMALPMPKRLPPGASKVIGSTTADLKAAAAGDYAQLKASGIEYSPEASAALADHVVSTMRSKGAYEHLAEPVHKTIDILRKDGPVSLDEIRSVTEALSGLKADPDKKIRRAAGIADTEIKSFLRRTEPVAGETLDRANANYAAASRADTLDESAKIAGLRAGRAGYGGNSVNTMRQVLSPIVEAAIKGNAKGFSPDEIRALNDIVVGTPTTNILRGVGQLSPARGVMQTGLALASGGTTAAIGAASNKLASILTSKQIDRVNQLVRQRSPAYAESIGKAANKYFDSAAALASDPSRANFINTIVASRALSAGLTRDGIQISSGDLLRLIGAKPGSADQENP